MTAALSRPAPFGSLRQFILFVLCASWLPWLLPILARQNVMHMPWFIAFGLGGCASSIAGLVLTWRAEGAPGLRRLLYSAVQLRFGWRWYALIFLLIPAVNILAILLSGGKFSTIQIQSALASPLSIFAAVFTTLLIGPLSEEFGWTGYAQPRFEASLGKVKGILLLTLCRVAWHLPMFIMIGTDQNQRAFLPFALAISGMGFLIAWVTQATRRSLAAAILIHFLYNLTIGTLLPLDNPAYTIRGILYGLLALAILLAWSRESTVKK